jgi:beta-glucosidase/6-phospho-beta-glucosidase/beta-galactosidase
MKSRAKDDPHSTRRRPHGPHSFLFATGIENSYPVVTGRDGRDVRVDEMEKCSHYARWREDFALVRELSLEYLRYGPPYYRTHCGADRFDWEFADLTLRELRRLKIQPIADLCHFGVPDWIGNFQNPDWPRLFASYAGAFARRFPWVRFYTPVNEIFVTATFSGQYGWWNERLSSDRAFVTALKNLARANLLAEEAILKARPEALFIQSESSEYFHPANPAAQPRAAAFNHKRFLSLDLSYGHDVRGIMYEYLMDNGMAREEYHWFLDNARRLRPYCVMGNDYYITNEHLVPEEGPLRGAGEIFGYYVITRQYYERYHLPVMHTETNLGDVEKAPAWLWKEWANMIRLKEDGVPILGFTWYSLTDQVDWDTTLREQNNNVNPLGLYDLDRKIRPVGRAYKELVEQWRGILPTESICLHPVEPEEFEGVEA